MKALGNIEWTDTHGKTYVVCQVCISQEKGSLYVEAARRDHVSIGAFIPLDIEENFCDALNERRAERKAKSEKVAELEKLGTDIIDLVTAFTAKGGA